MSATLQRILHVPRRFSRDEWGGTEAVITNLCEAQRAAGQQPEIHTSLALSSSRNEAFRGIPIYRYAYCYPFLSLSEDDKLQLDKKGGNLLSWQLYRALQKARDVRIYHAHVTKRTGASVLKAARQNKRPCVVTLHGNIFDVPKLEAENVVVPQAGKFEWGRVFGAYFGSRNMLEEVDAVLCVGFSEYEKARDALGTERVHFLPNGVHPERLVSDPAERAERRHRLGFEPEDFLFGCISRIDPQKDQLSLIGAFAEIAAEDPRCGLVICGPVTNAAYAEKLEAAVGASGCGQRIRILPPVVPDSDEHRSLFAALDCFTLPSRHEPFGIVVLEAWSAEKPVIAAKVGGLARLITHEKTGLHFPSGDIPALAAAMRRMRASPGLQAETVRSAKETVRQHYTWSRIATQLETIYESIESRYP